MWLGVDTGGTFTDFVLFDGQQVRTHKVLSTPEAPEKAILQGMTALGLLDNNNLKMVHGSTVATNAVLEGKGVKTVYIGNHGLGDVIRIGRQARPELYNLQPAPINYLVDAENILEVEARVAADGDVLQSPGDDELDQLKNKVAELAPESVAINLLFSYLDDSDEKRIESVLASDYFVSRSSSVLNEYREYERGMATCLNAYVGPLMQRYLSRLRKALPGVSLSIMQSNAGTISVEQAAKFAVNLLLSGPAGGLKGAQFVAAEEGERSLLSFDMGGTSTDVALIRGEIELTSEGQIAGFPVAVPMVDMHTIGAGGGSIARVDEAGMLLVGPESAGADPGPACYGKGGTQATVTDANVVLGRIPATQSLGGYLSLDIDAARAAVEKLAVAIGATVENAAWGIIQIANERMVQALRVISVQRGYDPKDFSLVSFGGAGGLHICELAESLSMHSALVPVHGGVLSALGMLVAEPARELSHTVSKILSDCDNEQIQRQFEHLIEQGKTMMVDELASCESQIKCYLDVCYQGQSFNLPVTWTTLTEVEKTFHQLHEQRYGHQMDNPVELVNLRVAIKARQQTINLPILEQNTSEPISFVTVIGEAGEVPVYQRENLGAGQKINGPALVVEKVATSYIKSGWQTEVDAVGNLLLTRQPN